MVDHVDVSTVTVDAIPRDEALGALPASPQAASMAAVLNGDPRLLGLEQRIQNNDWRGIAADLGPLDAVATLPPNLGLLGALAHHELAGEGDQQAVAIGIRCVASILGLPEKGAMAGVIGRRLFRKNPVRFRERKAPTARVSTLIILATLAFGSGAGWLASGGWHEIVQRLK